MLRISLFIMVTSINIASIFSQPAQEEINQARNYFNEGVQLGVKEDYKKSLEAFNNAIDINPIYTKAFLYRGLTKSELADYEGAIKDFTITIELDPAYSDQAHYFRGVAKYHNEDYQSSIQDITIAIKLNPDFISFLQRGKAYLKLKEYGRALQDFDISYRLNPGFDEIYLYRGITLYYLAQYKLAIEDLDIATQVMPGNPNAFYYSGLAKIEIQNSYAAIEELDKSIEIDPAFQNAYLARAQARKNTGNHSAAQDDLQMAEKLKDEDKPGLVETLQPSNDRETTPQRHSPETLDIAGFFSPQKRAEDTKPSAITSPEVKKTREDQETEKEKTAEDQEQDEPVEAEQIAFHETAENEASEERPAPGKTTVNIDQLTTGIYKHDLLKSEPKGFGIQVASYSNTDNLQNLASAYEEQFEKPVFINVNQVNNRKIYRIIIGQFNDRQSAETYREILRKDHFPDSFLVVFERLY